MRLGIFSDVHANIEALTAVMQAYENESIDEFHCLGDVVGYGANPNECTDIVRRVAKTTILGNHDAAVTGRMDYSYYYDAARHALDWHARALRPDSLAWLRGLPYQKELDGSDVLLCHGSPVRPEEFEYIFAPEQARECLPIWKQLSQITFIGHSHLCKVFALRPGEVVELPARTVTLKPEYKYIVSVGSVGQPRDWDPRASYVIFDTIKRELEFKRVEYDIASQAQKIFAAGLEKNFGHRLFLGV